MSLSPFHLALLRSYLSMNDSVQVAPVSLWVSRTASLHSHFLLLGRGATVLPLLGCLSYIPGYGDRIVDTRNLKKGRFISDSHFQRFGPWLADFKEGPGGRVGQKEAETEEKSQGGNKPL